MFSSSSTVTAATLVSATDPSPSPSDGVLDDVGEAATQAGESFWTWFTGWPLQVLITLVVGIFVLVLLRRVISHVTEQIATGGSKRGAEGSGGWKAWFSRTPLVEDAIAVANPLASERRAQRARTVGSVLNSTANIVVGVIVLLSVMSAVGYPMGPLLASAGVAGIALGFGAQSLVKDFISGVFILIEDQYGVGDWVDLGSGAEGEVEQVQLRTTQVRALDGTLWFVRNGEVLRAGNRTQRWSRAMATVRVPVDADSDLVRAALDRACARVATDPDLSAELLEPPAVRSGVDIVSDFSMAFTLLAQVRPGMQWEVGRALMRTSQAELRTVGVLRGVAIEMPSDDS